MLMLGDPGIGDILIAIIHHRTALVIPVIGEFFKIKGAIAQPTQLIVKIAIQRPGVEHMVIILALTAIKISL